MASVSRSRVIERPIRPHVPVTLVALVCLIGCERTVLCLSLAPTWSLLLVVGLGAVVAAILPALARRRLVELPGLGESRRAQGGELPRGSRHLSCGDPRRVRPGGHGRAHRRTARRRLAHGLAR